MSVLSGGFEDRFSLPDIIGHLLLQRLNRIEFLLIAEAGDEIELQPGPVKAPIVIDQVRFDRPLLPVESRAAADIGIGPSLKYVADRQYVLSSSSGFLVKPEVDMPYYVYRISEGRDLECLDQYPKYKEARDRVREIRAGQREGETALVRLIFASSEIEAERLLLTPREAPIEGDD